MNSSISSSISLFPIVFDGSMQNWALLFYFVLFFSTGFAWRSWANYRATGINPLVLPSADNALGYIGRAFKIVMILIFLYTVCAAFEWLPSFSKFWELPIWLSIFAWMILLSSWIWLLLAQSHMGKSWRIGIDEQRATALVTHGLFKYSRNPIFLSMRCALFDLTLISPTAPILALTVTAELLMQIQVRMEEAHLTQLHGQRYLDYLQRVNRWL
jgi:protein-S-isoprenylcysteine O-methyltransferase Ste14